MPGVGPLNLSGDTLAGIFSGRIMFWNDPAVAKENPGVRLPYTDVLVVHRSDGSGTTFVFTDYLSKVSPEWKSKVGAHTTVSWPTGSGQAQNAGVAGMVKQTPGAIGYVEFRYALEHHIPVSRIQNRAGAFVAPTLDSLAAAAAARVRDTPADFRALLVDAPGANAYPIASYTWLLVPVRFNEPSKRHAMLEFLSWMLAAGQADAQPLGYATIPKAIVVLEQRQLSLIR